MSTFSCCTKRCRSVTPGREPNCRGQSTRTSSSCTLQPAAGSHNAALPTGPWMPRAAPARCCMIWHCIPHGEMQSEGLAMNIGQQAGQTADANDDVGMKTTVSIGIVSGQTTACGRMFAIRSQIMYKIVYTLVRELPFFINWTLCSLGSSNGASLRTVRLV